MTDEQICEGCIRGEPASQKALYDRFARQMMAVCMRYARNGEQAQDILQDGFVKVFQKISSYRGDGPLGGWIARTMVNTALDHIRREKHYDRSVDLTEAEYLAQEESTAVSKLSTQELMEIIQALPPGYRSVFNMFAIEGYSHKEIANELGVTENTSKSQFMKAKAYLRKQLPVEMLKAYSGEG